MPVYEVDPISRIEGHLGVKVTVDGSGKITEANAHGNLWRGFENFLVGRRVNDAITFTQRICGVCPVPHGTASTLAADSVMGISEGYATFDDSLQTAGKGGHGIPAAGLLVRNLVLASELLMSNITHFYHLAALSYVQGPAVPPWTPYFDDTQYHPILLNKQPGTGGVARALPATDGSADAVPSDLWSAVVKQYVKALRIRRLTFEASAMFAGRAPMMSMSIAGGTTNAYRSKEEFQAKCDTFRSIMEEVGQFVVREYVPLAFALGALYPDFDSQGVPEGSTRGIGFGAGCGNFLAWGGFPSTGTVGTLKIKGGWKLKNSSVINELLKDRNNLTAAKALVEANLTECINRSRYADTLDEFGTDGKAYPGDVTRTIPKRDDANLYSWLKAPRWNNEPMEVGPLARMVVNGMYLVDGLTPLLTPPVAGAPANSSFPALYGYMYYNAAADGLDTQVIHPDLVAGLTSKTNPIDGVGGKDTTGTAVLGIVTNHLVGLTGGLSTMDRLRGRAIESLHAISWIIGLPAKTGTAAGITFSNTGWIDELKALGASSVPTFATPVNPPAGKVSGYGLTEAPRGALGHFVTGDNGKIVSYQCVVPTTWNASPKDGPDSGLAGGTTKRGPLEQAMIDVHFDEDASVSVAGADRMSGVEVLRVAQSFDPCIACAIH